MNLSWIGKLQVTSHLHFREKIELSHFQSLIIERSNFDAFWENKGWQINFFTDSFQRFQVNERFRMATLRYQEVTIRKRSFTWNLRKLFVKKHLWNSSLLYQLVEILQLIQKIAVSPRCSLEEMFWKNVSKSTYKHNKQSPGGVLSKDVLQNFFNFTEKFLLRSLFFNKVAGWKPQAFRSSPWRCSVKQGALKNFANLTGNNLCWSLSLIKLHSCGLQLYQRRLRYGFFHVKLYYYEEHLWISTCKLCLKRDSNIDVLLWILWINTWLWINTYFVEDLQMPGPSSIKL